MEPVHRQAFSFRITEYLSSLFFLFSVCCLSVFLPFFKILFICREKGREREGEGGKHQCESETSIGCLVHAPCRDSLQPGQVP